MIQSCCQTIFWGLLRELLPTVGNSETLWKKLLIRKSWNTWKILRCVMVKAPLRHRPFDFWGGGYGWFGLGKNFFPQTSGDRIFFLAYNGVRFIFSALYTLKDIFFTSYFLARIFFPWKSVCRIFFFLKSPIPTQKSNGQPLSRHL